MNGKIALSFMFLEILLVKANDDTISTLFKSELSKKVLPPFNKAVNIYKTDIIGKLSSLNQTQLEDTNEGQKVVKKLNCDVDRMHDAISKAQKGSDQVEAQMNGKLRESVAEESRLQREKSKLQGQQKREQTRLQNLNKQLSGAKQKVKAAEASLKAAQNRLRTQERRYDDAKNNCISRKRRRRQAQSLSRRKRFLGGLKKVVNKVIVKPAKAILKPIEKVGCRLLNRGGIKNAKHARNVARNNLNNEKSRLKKLQKQYSEKQAKLRKLNTDISRTAESLRTKSNQVKAIKQKREDVAEVSAKAKVLKTRIAVFQGRTKLFKDAAQRMIDFDQVIGPMNSIKEQLKKFNLSTTGIVVDPGTMSAIVRNLEALKRKLPNFPFVLHVGGCKG